MQSGLTSVFCVDAYIVGKPAKEVLTVLRSLPPSTPAVMEVLRGTEQSKGWKRSAEEARKMVHQYISGAKLRVEANSEHSSNRYRKALSLYESAFGKNAGDAESYFKAGAVLLSQSSSKYQYLDRDEKSLKYLRAACCAQYS